MVTNTFGASLKHWRTIRGLSQAVLGDVAEVSTRHISFLENQRAHPSREMVLVLANALDLPLRERNVLLQMAGFAKVYSESSLCSDGLKSIQQAIEVMLTGLHPNPCVVLDGSWNIVQANQGALSLMGWLYEDALPPPPINLVSEFFRPDSPLRLHCVNFVEPASWVAARLVRDGVADAKVKALWESIQPHAPKPRRGPPMAVVPVHFRKDDVSMRFFTTLTHFSATEDVTLSELKIETYFPADAATVERLADGFLD